MTTNAARPVVRRMVLFKHGVAHVERGGPCDGSFDLSFERAEMRDVLKSLAVWVAAGDARPTAIAFDKPDDPERALQARGLVLPGDSSFSALLTAFRGRRVSVREDEQTIVGEVIGLETRQVGQGVRPLVALRVDRGAVRLVDLERVREVRLDDPVAAADLELLLDRRRAASSHERRSVRIGVHGRAEDLRVAYVLPAPVWRVSYRIVAEADQTLVSAWAIVHNPLDEDVTDVELTLTTGQPISFDIDLYSPKTVERVVVEESSRAAAPPTLYERAPRAKKVAPPSSSTYMALRHIGVPTPPPVPAPLASMAAAAAGAVSLEDRGEFFEYRIAQPITLPRGGSALVPLIASPVVARKERIWRTGSAPAPDIVISFCNETGAVLEEGPAIVYDEGVYAGEAMVPYSARNTDVKLAYAKDLAVRCKHDVTSRWSTTGLRLGDQFAVEERQIEERHVLRADSDHDEEIEIVFELPKSADRRVGPADQSAQPFEETAAFRRFRATVPPHGHVEVVVIEIGATSRSFEYDDISRAVLADWGERGVLEGPLADALEGIVAAWEEAKLHTTRAESFREEHEAIVESQKRIAQQLEVLKEGGPEGELRLRYVRELGESQDRLAEVRRGIVQEKRLAADARRRAEALLKEALGRKPAT